MRHPRLRGHYERTGASLAWLGTLPDVELAARVGLREHHVRDARRRHGVSRASFSPAQSTVDYARIDPLLRSLSDPEIARRCGVSVTTVWARRRELGVPMVREHGICACGRPFEARGGALGKRRFCSTACEYAAKYARQRGGHEDLHVALWALRRAVRAGGKA